MHLPINVKSPNNISKWQMGFNSAFKGLKKVQKEEFSAAFQKLHDRAKDCIYANGAYFELIRKLCLFDV
jgi:hypothetical protein